MPQDTEQDVGQPMELEFHPVTIERWPDLAAFFEQHGNPNYCWCMRWRLKSTEFKQLKSAERRSKLEALIQENAPVGILGYHQDKPIG